MERVRKEGASRGSLSGPSPAPVDPAVLQAMGLPQINIEVRKNVATRSVVALSGDKRFPYLFLFVLASSVHKGHVKTLFTPCFCLFFCFCFVLLATHQSEENVCFLYFDV